MSSPCLPKGVMFTTKDLLTWKGWSLLNDREVVRLSAELGTHIQLAQTFIATRRGWDNDEVERWYKAEVTAWVIQLLSTGEITIAIQILENIQIDVVTQFLAIAKEAKDRETINTISRYLNSCVESEIGEIHDNIKDFLSHYDLLKALEFGLSHKSQFEMHVSESNQTEKLIITYEEINQYTVQDIQKKSQLWKSFMASCIFFEFFDSTVVSFLNVDISWDYLLTNNQLEILKIWIYVWLDKSKHSSEADQNIRKLHELFCEWEVTENMISRIYCLTSAEFVRNELFDYLATFGYFNEIERNDVVLFLNRISRNENICQIDILLHKSSSNVSLDSFYKILLDYCDNNRIKTVVTKCINSKLFTRDFIHNICGCENNHWLHISRTFLEMMENPNDEQKVLESIIITIKYLANNDIENYLVLNPAIFVGMVLFNDMNNISSILTANSDVVMDDITVHKQTILKIVRKLPHLNNFVHHMNEEQKFDVPDINLCKMLSNYNEIDICKLYKPSQDNGNLNFDDVNLMEQFGHKAKLPYQYYLKIASPCFAIKAFYIDKVEVYNNNTKQALEDGFNNACDIALKNWSDMDITSSCISLTEIIGMSSNKIRCYISAARYIKKALCNETMNSLDKDINEIDSIIQNITSNKQAVANLFLVLENSIMKNLKKSFTEILTQWKTTIAITVFHDLQLPNSFLIYCAQNNKWSWYLLFAEIYKYPLDQVTLTIKYFSSEPLRDHLIAAMKTINQSQYEKPGELLGIGTDFWSYLLAAHTQSNPTDVLLKICRICKGNPIFATMAICYKPDYIVQCWYAWLSSAIQYNDSTINEAYVNITINNISAIMDFSIEEGFISALNESFLIFFPENPLTTFTNFLCHTIIENDFENATEILISFKNSSITLHIMPHLNTDNIFKDRTWILNKAIKLCCIAVSCAFTSDFHNKQFLKCLCDAKLTRNIETTANFSLMFDLLECIMNTSAKLNISIISLSNRNDLKDAEYKLCLQQLVDGKYFEKSLLFAKITRINTDLVIIAQMKNRCNKLLAEGSTDINIWFDCDKKFHDSKLSKTLAVDFFLYFADSVEFPKFKYVLYYLALLWETSSNSIVKSIDEIEKNMWMNYLIIADTEDLKLFHSKSFDVTVKLNPLRYIIKDLKQDAGIDNLVVPEYQLTDDKVSNLNKLISTLLNLGDFVTALRVQVMFKFLHSELQLLITIMALAEGSLSPYQMTKTQRMTLMQSKCVRTASGQFGKRTLKSKLSTSSSMSHSPNHGSFMSAVFYDYVEIPSREKQDTLCTIEALAARLKAGRFAGERIVMCYRAAMHMDKDYTDVIQNVDILELLEEAVTSDCMNKLVVVSDLISASGFTSLQIAEYLAFEIFKSIVVGTNPKSKKEKTNLNVILLWGYNLSMDFHLFLELCPEPSHIGILLLDYLSYIQQSSKTPIEKGINVKSNLAKKYVARNIQFNISKVLKSSRKLSVTEINAVAIELLICAHDCYTRDCNIEGISLVLRRARMLCLQLLQTKCWGLMVKLLTGIARYTEMTYVFEILKSNDQFEYLLSQFNYILGQQDSKKNQLKMALLEFLKTYWPQDSELKRLVALHFQMHSEVAELLRVEAAETIKRLINIATLEMTNHDAVLKEMISEKSRFEQPYFALLTNSPDTRECLFRAMNSYSHSAEYYVQQNKLSLAMKATHEAELVALQIDLLNNASVFSKVPGIKCILQLKPEQISYMINKELNFLQGMILHRAYDYSVDWVSALYEHCIIKGEMQYLNSYNKHLEVSENMAQEIAMRFQKETQITKSMIESMRSIIVCVHSLTERYRLASLLGQRDIVENILSSESVCYLKDTVFIGKNS